jgi:hypothetical protein
MMASGALTAGGSSAVPKPGQIVHVRTRNHLVEAVTATTGGTIVQLACVDDDNQGSKAEVIWELEFDARILDEESWKSIGDSRKDSDPPRHSAVYQQRFSRLNRSYRRRSAACSTLVRRLGLDPLRFRLDS